MFERANCILFISFLRLPLLSACAFPQLPRKFHTCTLSLLLPPPLQMSFDPGMLHNNGHTAYANGSGPGIRETGVVEKLLTSYGFIQCSERQARLFFHCSQYNGNLQDLKIGGEWP